MLNFKHHLLSFAHLNFPTGLKIFFHECIPWNIQDYVPSFHHLSPHKKFTQNHKAKERLIMKSRFKNLDIPHIDIYISYQPDYMINNKWRWIKGKMKRRKKLCNKSTDVIECNISVRCSFYPTWSLLILPFSFLCIHFYTHLYLSIFMTWECCTKVDHIQHARFIKKNQWNVNRQTAFLGLPLSPLQIIESLNDPINRHEARPWKQPLLIKIL